MSHVVLSEPELVKKNRGTMMDPWKFCKLVEEDPTTGQLILLKDNVVKLRKHLSSSDSTVKGVPIAFTSVLGERSSGKSLYTNLIAEYLNNAIGWTASIRDKGLQGFAFGSTSTTDPNGKLVPDEDKSGVYFWPQVFHRDSGNGAKLLWIMHVHHKKLEDESLKQSSLDLLLAIASSAVIDIFWKEEKTCVAALTENVSQPLKNQLCSHVVNLVRKVPNEPSPNPSTFTNPEKVFPIGHSDVMSGESDKIKLGMQLSQQLSKLFKKVTDETELVLRMHENKIISLANFEDYLACCINLVNSNQGPPQRKPSCSRTSATSYGTGKPITATATTSQRFEEKSSKSGNRKSKTASGAPPPKCAPRRPPPTADKQPDLKNKEEKENTPSSTKSNDVKAKTTLKKETQDDPVPEKANQVANSEATLNWPIIEKNLQQRLVGWIELNLKRDNVGEIKKSFKVILHAIIKDQMKEFKLKEKVYEELFKKVTATERYLKYEQVFLIVEEALTDFCSRIDDLFRIIAILPPHRLRKNMETIINDIGIGVEKQNVRDLVEKGCNKMIPYYEAVNERKMQAEKNISQECSHEIRNFYKEEMERILEGEKYYHPVALKSIHETLVICLEKVNEDSLRSCAWVGDVAVERANLKRNLDNDFDAISNKNMREIEKCQKSVKDLVAKLKSEYEVKMDTFIQDHPEGVPLERFTQEQDEYQRAQIEEFKKKIVTLVKEGERGEQHVNTLVMYMEKSRGYFEEENQDNLKETEKKKASKGKKGKKSSSKRKNR